PAPRAHVGWFDVTADGARVVYQVQRGDDDPGLSELWSVSLVPSVVRTRLAETDGGHDFELAPDGRRIVYQDRRARLYGLDLDGGSSPVLLARGSASGAFQVSPDGGRVLGLAGEESEGGGSELGLFSVPTDGRRPSVKIGGSSTASPGGRLASSAGSVGFRDFSFGTTGSSTPT